FGKADKPCLGSAVIGLARISGRSDDGTDIDDQTKAATHHRVGQLAGQPEHRAEIDLKHRIPVFVRHAHEETVTGDSCIIDKDINAFQLGFGLLAQRLDVGAVRQVRWQHLDAVAKIGGQRVELFDTGAVDADNGTGCVKGARYGLANAT